MFFGIIEVESGKLLGLYRLDRRQLPIISPEAVFFQEERQRSTCMPATSSSDSLITLNGDLIPPPQDAEFFGRRGNMNYLFGRECGTL